MLAQMSSTSQGECNLLEGLSSAPILTDVRCELTTAIGVFEWTNRLMGDNRLMYDNRLMGDNRLIYDNRLMCDIRFARFGGTASYISAGTGPEEPNAE